ncbi:hypothetical protein BH09ACT5_BH09ACT5_07340 [soil metagenome]
MSRRAAGALVLAVVAASLAACAAAPTVAAVPPVGHAELQLVGQWTGEPDRQGEGVVEMAVSDAADDGTSFDGDLTFTATGSASTEQVHAEMTPHGHLVAAIGEDASIEMHIVDPRTLDYCFIRYGTDFVYSCGRLVRQQ